jgi:hypothetical protein
LLLGKLSGSHTIGTTIITTTNTTTTINTTITFIMPILIAPYQSLELVGVSAKK